MSQTRIGRLFERLRAEKRRRADRLPHGRRSLARSHARAGGGAGARRRRPDRTGRAVFRSHRRRPGDPARQRARAARPAPRCATVLEIAREIRKRSEIPLLLVHLSESGAALRPGASGARRRGRGIDGCLLTDLSVEEAEPYVAAMRAAGLDTVFLAAPTSTRAAAATGGAIFHAASSIWFRAPASPASARRFPTASRRWSQAMRAVTTLPLAVGFGISTPEQVRAVGELADGVVVGSAFVRTIEQYAASAELESRLEALARELSSGLPSKNR